jgi:hypothetical protein
MYNKPQKIYTIRPINTVMIAVPPLVKTGEDLVKLSPKMIESYFRTNYGPQTEQFFARGGVILKPPELMEILANCEVGNDPAISVYPEQVELAARKLDDDFYATACMWIPLQQYLSSWEVRWLEEVTHLYYAALIWSMVELR